MPDTRYVNEILTDDEELVDQFGYHWTRYIRTKYFVGNLIPPVIVAGIVAAISYFFPELMLWAIGGGVVLWFLVAWFVWTYITTDVRIVTNRRVVLKEGFFSRRTQEIKLSAIEAIEFEQSFIERLLRVGCLEITGRGGGTVIGFHHVARPLQTKHMIENIKWRETGEGAYNPEIDG